MKILTFFIALLQHFFKFFFSSSSINAKQKFWGAPHLLHIFVCKITRESLKLGVFTIDQVADMFCHVLWLSVISITASGVAASGVY